MIRRNIYLILTWIVIGLNCSAQVVNFSVSDQCFGDLTLLVGASDTADSDIASWSWDIDDDGNFDDATGKSINYTFNQPDTFIVGLKIRTNSGFEDSISKQVVIYPLPEVNFHVDNTCEDQAAIYTDQSNISSGTITQYQWDFNNDGAVDDISSGPLAYYTVGPAETFVSRLTCISDKGCASFATKTTEVFPQPVAKFTSQNACVNQEVSFQNTSSINNGVIELNLWDFGDGNQSVLTDPVHSYENANNHNARLIVVSDKNCRDTATAEITVYDLPEISFTYSPDTAIKEGETVNITAISDGNSFSWSNGSTSDQISVNGAGSYIVTVTTSNGCTASAISSEIIVNETLDKPVVNELMTPNGDGQNDLLIVEGMEGNCEVSVYNRWNNLVFTSSSYQNDWDGTSGGKQLDAGTYFYIIKCPDKEQQVGSFNILR